jgi:hypothetical protein
VNEIGERLSTSRSLMKIRTLPAESVCRRYRLGLKAVSAYRTAQYDFPQRRHALSPLLAIFSIKEISMPPFIRKSRNQCPCSDFHVSVFSRIPKRAALSSTTRDLVVDADQPAA